MIQQQYTLLIDCPDQIGLVYQITSILYQFHLNITKNDEFVDLESNHFFMRTEFKGNVDAEALLTTIQQQLPKEADVKLSTQKPKNIVVLATKEPHCLGDLLLRNEYNEINAKIVAVISNHKLLQPLVQKFNLPFYFIDHNIYNSRLQHEQIILQTISNFNPDYLVLAKYMRILSPEFVAQYTNKIINIHHSFLPAFVGANPYKQAYTRGVKIIGATAHYVNNHLDEGAIIHQDVIPVSHRFSADEMAKAGKDVEKIVLAKALQLVFNNRVFIHGNKTIIF